MTGLFAQWQPRYAAQGVATFPTLDKKPMIRGWQHIGVKGSAQLALKFPAANELAFLAGPRSGLTIVDVDTTDEDVWRDALRRYGETPVMVRTGSGHLQLWYRYGGEGRQIRADHCIDILGTGQVLGPPSDRGQGYQLLRGTLADIHNLPPVRNIVSPRPIERIHVGGRNKALMEFLRSQARYVDDLQGLNDVGLTFADDHLDRETGHAFTDSEVESIAKSVMQWTEDKIAQGQYYVGTGRYLQLGHDDLDRVFSLGADAVMLFMYLKRRSDHRKSLIVANDMRLTMPDGEWTLTRFRKARKALLEAGILKETRSASTWHGPARYQWQG